MYDKVAEIAVNYPRYIAYDFMGGKVRYKDFIRKVDECARALQPSVSKRAKAGRSACRTRTLQAIIMFYAVNKVGADRQIWCIAVQ